MFVLLLCVAVLVLLCLLGGVVLLLCGVVFVLLCLLGGVVLLVIFLSGDNPICRNAPK